MKPPITKEGQAAKERIATARANKNAGGVREGGTYAAPISPAPTLGATATAQTAATTPITSTALAPTTPVTLAEPTPATQAAGMTAEFQDATDTYTKNLEAQAKAAEAPKQNALSDYLGQLQGAKGLSQLTAESYAGKGGVDEITPELNDINDKIRREQLSMRRQAEAVAQAGGQSKAQAQAQINNIERESFAKQADLSIIQMAVQGRYDSAKEIADRAVAAQFEQQTNDLAIKKFNYEENKELFTKAEQRAFEAAQGDRERKLTEERENATQIKQFALSALEKGASVADAQRIMSAKTLNEAISIGGSYFRPKPAAVGSTKPSITEIDGKPFIWNEATGQFVPAGDFIQGGGVSSDQNEQLKQTLDLANELKKPSFEKSGAVGFGFQKFVLGGRETGLTPGRNAFENKVNTLKANLTLDNLGLLKGPMSDKDLAFLQAIGSSLTTNMSEKEFDKELDKVISRLQKAQSVTPKSFSETTPIMGAQNILRLPDTAITAPDGSQVIIVD